MFPYFLTGDFLALSYNIEYRHSTVRVDDVDGDGQLLT
jgi:hypothetical protein